MGGLQFCGARLLWVLVYRVRSFVLYCLVLMRCLVVLLIWCLRLSCWCCRTAYYFDGCWVLTYFVCIRFALMFVYLCLIWVSFVLAFRVGVGFVDSDVG